MGHVFELKGERGGRLTIDVLRRQFPNSTDYWDGNWLACQVSVTSGGFGGSFAAMLRVDEMVRLRDGMRSALVDMKGTFRFEAMEEQLKCVGSGDGLGHFLVEGVARDDVGIGNRLTFELETDQTFLAVFGMQLDGVLEAFPLVGKP